MKMRQSKRTCYSVSLQVTKAIKQCKDNKLDTIQKTPIIKQNKQLYYTPNLGLQRITLRVLPEAHTLLLRTHENWQCQQRRSNSNLTLLYRLNTSQHQKPRQNRKSVSNKINELIHVIEQIKPEVIILTEHSPKKEEVEGSLLIPCYNLQ